MHLLYFVLQTTCVYICTYMIICALLSYIYSQFTEWESNLSPVDVRPFVQPTGLVAESTGDPGDLFALLFTPEIIRSIVVETNRYAAFCLRGSASTWTTDEQEIRAYFGFYILMGLVRLPEIRDYWSNSDTFHYAPVADRISRKRFEEISRYLHFVDKESLPAPTPAREADCGCTEGKVFGSLQSWLPPQCGRGNDPFQGWVQVI